VQLPRNDSPYRSHEQEHQTIEHQCGSLNGFCSAISFPEQLIDKGRRTCTALEVSVEIRYGPMLAGWHAEIEAGVGGAGGVDHGTALKSKNSSRFGCAASRLVKCAEGLMKRLSTNLITAV